MSEGRTTQGIDDGSQPQPRHPGRTIGESVAVAAASLALAWRLLHLWKADLRVPFDYRSDGILHSMTVKAIVENGGYLVNPLLGAPGELHHHDFPFASEWAHILAIRALALLTSNWAVVTNVYFILGFPLIAVCAFVVLRHAGIGFAPAAAAALLYAFLPSRMLKGESHLFLDTFYQVPLAVLVALWVCSDAPPFFRIPSALGRRPGDSWGDRSLAAIFLCILVSATDLYYAFFAGWLIVAGGIWASIERRSLRNAVAGAALGAVIAIGILANLAPSLIYEMQHGANPEVAHRLPQEAEMYGMKIAQLLMPAADHPLAPLRRLARVYGALTHGGEACSIGAVSGAGFLILLGRVVSYRHRPRDGKEGAGDREDPFRTLAVLNLFAVLLATVGGFGSLFAWLVSPQIRSYARMNVVIGFLGLFAIALCLDRLERWPGRSRRPGLPGTDRAGWIARASSAGWLQGSAALAILAFGLFDQVTPGAVRDYGNVKAAFAADADLVSRMEKNLPRGAAIFELPYHSFPEAPVQNEMADYDPARPYLHSRTLRWSYPAMRNRFEDVWTRQVAEQEPARMVALLSDAEFGGVLIDRPGYADNAADIEATLTRILQAGPQISADGRLAFFDLTAHERHAFEGETADERSQRRDRALHPLLLRWGGGFYYQETSPHGTYRWGSGSGEVVIENGSPAAKWAKIEMGIFAAHPPTRLTMGGDLVSESVEVPRDGTSWARTVRIAPGDHVVRFHSDGVPLEPGDLRSLVWGAENLRITEVEPPRE